MVDDYFGTRVADPYRWMEDLNAPEVEAMGRRRKCGDGEVPRGMPVRDELKTRITELWNYPKITVPHFEGGRWFYTRNTGLQRQSVVYVATRSTAPSGSSSIRTRCRLTDRSRCHMGAIARRTLHRCTASPKADPTGSCSTCGSLPTERPAGRHSMGEVQRQRVDERRQGLLLRPLSRAAGRQGARSGGPRQEDLLPRDRHAAVGRPPDLRAPRRADAVPRCRDRRDRAAISSSRRTKGRATRTSCS